MFQATTHYFSAGILFCLTVLGLICLPSSHTPRADDLKQTVSPYHFRLPSTEGGLSSPFDDSQSELTVICFLGTECPLARLYASRLQALSQHYAHQNVTFLGVNSNLHDSMEDWRSFGKQHAILFRLLKDAGNKVADAYSVSRTTEVIVLDRQYEIRYRGRIDDQYQPGLSRAEPTRYDLQSALDELLAGKAVSVPVTTPVGCLIGRVPQVAEKTDYTFAHEVSRILQKHCVECHREGEIGPFSLTDYDEVVGWGEMMLEVIDQGRMPPWHADTTSGHFANARVMPETDKEILRNWVAGGMPLGDAAQLPPPLEAVSKWQMDRDPDLVLEMSPRPFQVPAEGVVEYQYFVVDPGFEEDRWVTGAQVIPGNRSVVHHCIVFIRPPDGSDYQGVGWLSGYVPGQQPLTLKPGYGRHLPAGSKLVFQMHYTPTGTPQQDITQLGLTFAPAAEITHNVFTVIGINQDFEIPPLAAHHEIQGTADWFPSNGELLAITPHMHLRGKSFEVSMESSGKRHRLLKVPRYDFNWQHFYVFEEPLPLKDVDELHFTATFDNSRQNPVNPDPNEHVSWGDQTWQEMAIVFFAVAQPLHDETPSRKLKTSVKQSGDTQRGVKVEEFVKSFFLKFDANRDGKIVKEELPLAMKSVGFNRLNMNGDDHLSRDEIREHAIHQLTIP